LQRFTCLGLCLDDPAQSIFRALVVWRDARDEAGFFLFAELSVEASA
jgi:hypothetical protein